MTDANFQLSRLTRSIEESMRTWQSPAGQPTLADMSEAVRGWVNDIQRLDGFKSLMTPAFKAAKQCLQDAWFHRDDRSKSMDAITEAIDALRAIPGQLYQPEAKTLYEQRAAKSLFGEDVAHEQSNVPMGDELYTIHRTLSAYAADPQGTDTSDFRHLRDNLTELSERYVEDSRVHGAAFKAIQHLRMAEAMYDAHGRQGSLDNAIKAVDTMAHFLGKRSAPTGYKAKLTGSNRRTLADRTQGLLDDLYGYKFGQPQTLLRRVAPKIKSINKALGQFDDQKAQRLAEGILKNLRQAYSNANHPSVKSLGEGGWLDPDVAQSYNNALDQTDKLLEHLQDI